VLLEYATDPICGMSVAVAPAEHLLEHEGTTYYFCGPGCLRKFEAAHV
jgi:YHS domain-containing protein